MVFLIIMLVIILLLELTIIAVTPGGIPESSGDALKVFSGLYCAHRGLHTKDKAVPENSLPAFKLASEKGFGIELDLQMTTDGEIMVFHDYDLKRTCGVDRIFSEMSYKEISKLRLFDTNEHIPLLTEVLDIIGDTPVLAEIKPSGKNNKQISKKTYDIMQSRGVTWCMQSFDPRICNWYKKNAPHILRGQLSCPPGEFIGISKISSFVLGNLLFNFLSRPHFISYMNKPYPLIVKLCMIMKPVKAIWTIDSDNDIDKIESENNIIIFEQFTPNPGFNAS